MDSRNPLSRGISILLKLDYAQHYSPPEIACSLKVCSPKLSFRFSHVRIPIINCQAMLSSCGITWQVARIACSTNQLKCVIYGMLEKHKDTADSCVNMPLTPSGPDREVPQFTLVQLATAGKLAVGQVERLLHRMYAGRCISRLAAESKLTHLLRM